MVTKPETMRNLLVEPPNRQRVEFEEMRIVAERYTNRHMYPEFLIESRPVWRKEAGSNKTENITHCADDILVLGWKRLRNSKPELFQDLGKHGKWTHIRVKKSDAARIADWADHDAIGDRLGKDGAEANLYPERSGVLHHRTVDGDDVGEALESDESDREDGLASDQSDYDEDTASEQSDDDEAIALYEDDHGESIVLDQGDHDKNQEDHDEGLAPDEIDSDEDSACDERNDQGSTRAGNDEEDDDLDGNSNRDDESEDDPVFLDALEKIDEPRNSPPQVDVSKSILGALRAEELDNLYGWICSAKALKRKASANLVDVDTENKRAKQITRSKFRKDNLKSTLRSKNKKKAKHARK
ncbi:hypothetical protein BDV95DRAFT_601714 [Massariosphaeria phaeospora]|uniref:Uncharacterized protein n=1 Tax=Massariosphaeria phaeospora TaxID=100035 RepID=A0A7C8MUI1_9PLEO|nr:hypothetical protein BDV95DRAFT_601714 [Massariosphaeria phaeospora]